MSAIRYRLDASWKRNVQPGIGEVLDSLGVSLPHPAQPPAEDDCGFSYGNGVEEDDGGSVTSGSDLEHGAAAPASGHVGASSAPAPPPESGIVPCNGRGPIT